MHLLTTGIKTSVFICKLMFCQKINFAHTKKKNGKIQQYRKFLSNL